jgi:hypothetical protein
VEEGYYTSIVAQRVVEGDEPGAWGYNWAALSVGDMQRPGPPGWGLEEKLTTLLCKKKLRLRNLKKWKSDSLIHVERHKSGRNF